eukprot:scaffold118955_cov19-Tisochrysis_lutea.AAC.6
MSTGQAPKLRIAALLPQWGHACFRHTCQWLRRALILKEAGRLCMQKGVADSSLMQMGKAGCMHCLGSLASRLE